MSQINRDAILSDYRTLLNAFPPGWPSLQPAWPPGKPAIVMMSYDEAVYIGGDLHVQFRVTSRTPIIAVTVDLLGDGWSGTTIRGDDLRMMFGMIHVPQQVGTYQLQVRCTAANGETDATQRPRPVMVMVR